MKNETITLDSPLQRGDTTINTLELRRPKAAELRGIPLASLVQLDVDALHTALTRITVPTLTKKEVGQLDAADMMKAGMVVAGFLLPKDKVSTDSE